MTTRWVALLRGVNVGRGNRIAMADLRALVAELGYSDVTTLLSSGNVVFAAPPIVPSDPGPRIEAALLERLGVRSRVTTLRADELDRAIEANPLLATMTDPARLYVTVLASEADATRLDDVLATTWQSGAIAVRGRVAYVWAPDGALDSAVNVAAMRALGDRATQRNWTTTLKLGAAARLRGAS